MNEKIRNILLKLENENFKAYVIGGFVRDYIMGRETYDVDIATSALPKDTIRIFGLQNSNDENYGNIYFKDSLYNYDITTFRKELKYEERKPIDYEFVEDIDTDRRDFTINAMYMDKDGNISDPCNGMKDIEDKIIRVIGSINDKMVEDPLRILRAIRFASLLDFSLENNLKLFIQQNKQYLKTLSYTRKKEELDKIFKGSNKLKGIRLIKKLGLEDVLEIKFNDEIIETESALGIWAQMEYSDNYSFKNSDVEHIKNIKNILNYGIIDNIVLYQYGLFDSIIAGEILGAERTIISEEYKNLPIYSSKDICMSGKDIIGVLNIDEGVKIKNIIHDIEINILSLTLKNDYEEIKKYLLDNWR